jgi:hypothetical protein
MIMIILYITFYREIYSFEEFLWAFTLVNIVGTFISVREAFKGEVLNVKRAVKKFAIAFIPASVLFLITLALFILNLIVPSDGSNRSEEPFIT